MNKLKRTLKTLLIILVPVTFLLSIGLLIYSKGFHYSDFKNRIEVNVISDNPENVKNFINNFNHSNKAYSNSETGVIYFQHIGKVQVEEALAVNPDENINLEVKEVLVNNKVLIESYFVFFVLTFVTFAGVIFYIVLKDRGIIKLSELIKFYLPYSISYLISSVIFLGLFSLISRFYYLSEFEFTPIYLLNILISIVFFFAVYGFDKEEEITTLIIGRKYFSKLESYTLPFIICAICFIPALVISLGIKTIPVWAAFLVSWIIIYVSVRWIYTFAFTRFDLSSVRERIKRKPAKKEKRSELTSEESRPRKKDKDKKKKKKKNKKI